MKRVSSLKKPCGGTRTSGSRSPWRSETTNVLPSSTLIVCSGMGCGERADDVAIGVLVGAGDDVCVEPLGDRRAHPLRVELAEASDGFGHRGLVVDDEPRLTIDDHFGGRALAECDH